jgi:short-subunit dehydrogenase
VRAVRLDLTSRESIEESASAIAELGQVDLLINNAGTMTGGLLEEQELDDVYTLFQVSLAGVVHLTKLVLPGMLRRGRGKIVNNASISGYVWFPAASTYAAAKAGVVAFSESLRRELAGTGVSVLHLVTPGVNTEMLDATKEAYGRHLDTSGWTEVEPEEWADKVAQAIADDDQVLGPGGVLAVAKLLSRGPALLLDLATRRSFSRDPR